MYKRSATLIIQATSSAFDTPTQDYSVNRQDLENIIFSQQNVNKLS